MLFLFSEVLGVRDELWRARRVLLSLSSLSFCASVEAASGMPPQRRRPIFSFWELALVCARAHNFGGREERRERESDFGRAVGFKRVKLILDRKVRAC